MTESQAKKILDDFGARIGRSCPKDFKQPWMDVLKNLVVTTASNALKYFESVSEKDFVEWPGISEFEKQYKRVQTANHAGADTRGCDWCEDGSVFIITVVDGRRCDYMQSCRRCTGKGVDLEHDLSFGGGKLILGGMIPRARLKGLSENEQIIKVKSIGLEQEHNINQAMERGRA